MVSVCKPLGLTDVLTGQTRLGQVTLGFKTARLARQDPKASMLRVIPTRDRVLAMQDYAHKHTYMSSYVLLLLYILQLPSIRVTIYTRCLTARYHMYSTMGSE